MRTVKIRRFNIERGAYDCQKDESEVTIRFTIYDQDEDKGAYYGTFIFYPDMTMEIMWEDIDNEEMDSRTLEIQVLHLLSSVNGFTSVVR